MATSIFLPDLKSVSSSKVGGIFVHIRRKDHFLEKKRPARRSVMASSTRSVVSVEKEAEAQALAERIRELADAEILQMARLLVHPG
jgi:hypothetical protein